MAGGLRCCLDGLLGGGVFGDAAHGCVAYFVSRFLFQYRNERGDCVRSLLYPYLFCVDRVVTLPIASVGLEVWGVNVVAVGGL